MHLVDVTMTDGGEVATRRLHDLMQQPTQAIFGAGGALLHAVHDGRSKIAEQMPTAFMTFEPTSCPTVAVVRFEVQKPTWPGPIAYTTNIVAVGGHPDEAATLRRISATWFPSAESSCLDTIGGRPALWTMVTPIQAFAGTEDDVTAELMIIPAVETVMAFAFAMLVGQGQQLTCDSVQRFVTAGSFTDSYSKAIEATRAAAGPTAGINWRDCDLDAVTAGVGPAAAGEKDDPWQAAVERLRHLRSHNMFPTADPDTFLDHLARRGIVTADTRSQHERVLRHCLSRAGGVVPPFDNSGDLTKDPACTAVAALWAQAQPRYPLPADPRADSNTASQRAREAILDLWRSETVPPWRTVAITVVTASASVGNAPVAAALEAATATAYGSYASLSTDSPLQVARQLHRRLADDMPARARLRAALPGRPDDYRLPADAASGLAWALARDLLRGLVTARTDRYLPLDPAQLGVAEEVAVPLPVILMLIGAAALRRRLCMAGQPSIDAVTVAGQLVEAGVLPAAEQLGTARVLCMEAEWAAGVPFASGAPLPPPQDSAGRLRYAAVSAAIACLSGHIGGDRTDCKDTIDAAIALACDIMDGLA